MFWLGVRLDRTFLTSPLVQKTIKTYFISSMFHYRIQLKFFHNCLHKDKDVYFRARCSSVVEVCWQGCIQALSAQLLSQSSVTLDTCYQSYPPPTHPHLINILSSHTDLLSTPVDHRWITSTSNLVISERLISLLYRFFSSSTKTT